MESKTRKKKFYMHKISNLLNIQKIVTIHYQALPQDYVSHEEAHDFWEIIYADKDDITVVTGENATVVSQGELLFIKPNEPHFVESKNKRANIFIISFSCHSESMSFFADKKYSVPEQHRVLLEIIMSEAKETFIMFFCYCAIEQTAGLWASRYLVLGRGVDAQTAAAFASLFYIGITVGRGISGFITLKLNDEKMISDLQEIEMKYNITFSDDDLNPDNLTTIKNIVDMMENYL